MMVPLPLGEPDPVRRLELIAAETAARKNKARPEAGSGIFRFVACQRVCLRPPITTASKQAQPAVVVGTSAGATIAVDLAVRRPDLVQAVIAHEAAWRASRHLPNTSQLAAVAKIGWQTLRGRDGDAAETLLRAAYSYRDGGTAWDALPEEWRRIARENARPALLDFRNSIGNYPSAADLANVAVPVVCSYGTRSPDSIISLTRSLAAAIPTATTHQIEGAGHAAPLRCNIQLRAADRRHHRLRTAPDVRAIRQLASLSF
jgi:pimeloyl-ACP methyl ester carboxylesterase